MDRQFNTFSLQEYLACIEQHERTPNFNTLGLYRSLTENPHLSLEEKIAVRDFAHRFFQKQFDFLQIKDPYTYVKVFTLGETLTQADERQIWRTVFQWQQKTLNDKKIKHRNFGDYSKHNCGDSDCMYNGLMVHQSNARLKEMIMIFDSDSRSHNYSAREVEPLRLQKESRAWKNQERKNLEPEDE